MITEPLLSDQIHRLTLGERLRHTVVSDDREPLAIIQVDAYVSATLPVYAVRTLELLTHRCDWDRSADLFSPHSAADFAYRMMRLIRLDAR